MRPAATAVRRRQLLAVGCSLALVGTPSGWAADPGSAEARIAVFDEVWRTVRDHFYDPKLGGLDWPGVRARYLPQAAAASSDEGLCAVINAMLGELRASHTQFYTPNDTSFFQLADIFAGTLRHRGLDRVFPGGRITYPSIGAFTRADADGRTFVIGVVEDTPAQRAGLLLGDEIVSVDGAPFEPVASFRGKVGKHVTLAIRRVRDGPIADVGVTPGEIAPGEMFQRGMEASARVIDAPGGTRIGYVHVWSYAGMVYQRLLERMIAQGPLRDADALVWDLRDGWGGAEARYLDIFNPRAPTMTLIGRDGESEFEDVKWRKPVAVLVNGGTRSGKEVLAYGFKKYGLGEVVGSPTAGFVLAATAFLIGDAGLLLLAVDDARVDGVRLEGVGVAPTVEIAFDPRYAAGQDPQLDRAVQLLSRRSPG